jgi:integrase/recombinase XerD
VKIARTIERFRWRENGGDWREGDGVLELSFYRDGRRYRMRAETTAELATGGSGAVDATRPARPIGGVMLKEAADSYLDECTHGIRNRYGKPKSVGQAKKDEFVLGRLVTRFAGRKLGSITTDDLERYLLDRSKEVIPLKGTTPTRATLNRDTATITGFFRFCVEKGLCSSNPASSFKQRRENNLRLDKVVPKGDLVSWTKELQGHPLARDIFKVLANAAMRVGECLSLKSTDFRYDEGKSEVFIRDPKELESTWLPVNDTVTEILESGKSRGGEFLFPNPKTGRPYSISGIRKVIFAARDRAKLPDDFTLHDLRRTAATRMMETGADMRTIQVVLRHKSLETTMRYLGVGDSRRLEAVRKLDSMEMNSKRETLW